MLDELTAQPHLLGMAPQPLRHPLQHILIHEPLNSSPTVVLRTGRACHAGLARRRPVVALPDPVLLRRGKTVGESCALGARVAVGELVEGLVGEGPGAACSGVQAVPGPFNQAR